MSAVRVMHKERVVLGGSGANRISGLVVSYQAPSLSGGVGGARHFSSRETLESPQANDQEAVIVYWQASHVEILAELW